MPDAKPDVPLSRKGPAEPEPFERARRLLVLACLTIAGGLAVAGSLDRSTGGVLLLVGWLMGVFSLHRLGRAGVGSERKERG